MAASPATPAAKPLRGRVLVWADATFYLSPDAAAPTVKLATLDDRTSHVGEAMPMDVIAEHGDFVEVSSGSQRSGVPRTAAQASRAPVPIFVDVDASLNTGDRGRNLTVSASS